MCRMRLSSSSWSETSLGDSRSTLRTTARCQEVTGTVGMAGPDGSAIAAATRPAGCDSVTLVSLLSPRVTTVVVPVGFPETGLVAVEHREPSDPFGALPEVQMRYQQANRPAVLG